MIAGGVCEDSIAEDAAIVGDHGLFEPAPNKQLNPADGITRVERPSFSQLRQKRRCLFDGASDQLWEEADKCGKCDEVSCRFELPPVDVDGVAEGLKGVETDADRQDDLPSRGPHVDAHRRPRTDPALQEEVCVLEDGQESQVYEEGSDEPSLGPGTSRFRKCVFSELLKVRFGDLAPHEIIDQRRESNQTQKLPVPPAIEHVGRAQKQQVLQPQPAVRCRPAVHHPIHRKDRDEEKQKFN